MKTNFSHSVGRFNIMNLRFWGGWFLAIAGISILLTMGCEKGALGVKPATVVGQIVDRDNPAIPVANAVVRMISQQAVGSNELTQGNNFVSAVTGTDGRFVFESVQADNVLFEYSAPGYASMIYPKKSTEEGEGEAAEVEFVSIRSGAFVDLRMLPLQKISNPLPATINVKIDLVDQVTQQPINLNPANESLLFTISLNGAAYTKSAQMWRDQGVTISPSASIRTVVRHEALTPVYSSRDDITIDGNGDVFQRIELTPVSYQLSLRCINVPDYIVGSAAVVNLFAEIPAYRVAGVDKPAQIIRSAVMQTFGDMYVLELPGIALQSAAGVHLRIQIRGYYDEVVHITSKNLKEGTQGNYRLDIDFLHRNDVQANDLPTAEAPTPPYGTVGVTYSDMSVGTETYPVPYVPEHEKWGKAGLYDNMKRRDVRFVVSNLFNGDEVSMAAISLPNHGGPIYDRDPNLTSGLSNGNPVTVDFLGVAVGYNMSYAMTVRTVASGTFGLSKDGLMVNPENEPTPSTLLYTVNWLDEYEKLKESSGE